VHALSYCLRRVSPQYAIGEVTDGLDAAVLARELTILLQHARAAYGIRRAPSARALDAASRMKT